MAKYLITGGAGFIGSHIVYKLLEMGESVRVVDNLSTGSLDNLSSVLEAIEFIKGDIRNSQVLKSAMKDIDYVIHHAALISVRESVLHPDLFHETNVTATLQILNYSKEFKVKRVIIASSSAVYGLNDNLPLCEEIPVSPVSPYGMSKYVDELYAKLYSDLYGVDAVCLRYFNIFGPGQRADSPYAAVIPNFINKLLFNKQPFIYGTGEQTRDFIFVDDVVEANILACQQPNISGEVFNISCGRRISINDLYKKISDFIGVNIEPKYLPAREGDILHSMASIKKAVRLLGFKPSIGLDEGLAISINWYKAQYETAVSQV